MNPDLDELERLLHAAITLGDNKQVAAVSAQIDAYPTPGNATPLGAALWYAQKGLHVFPLAPGAKIPHRGTKGCLDASADEAAIRAWWDRWPGSNVGIACGYRVDVVDVDGLPGQRSRATHWQVFDSLDQLGAVITPRPGGMHVYVPAHPDATNGANLLPGVDLRAKGGYVVAPPSVISPEWAIANDASAGPYRWLHPLRLP